MPSPGPVPRLDASARCDLPPLLVRLDLVGGRLELHGHLDHRTAHLLRDAIAVLLQAGGAGRSPG